MSKNGKKEVELILLADGTQHKVKFLLSHKTLSSINSDKGAGNNVTQALKNCADIIEDFLEGRDNFQSGDFGFDEIIGINTRI